MEWPTDMAVLGMARIMYCSDPTMASIFRMLKPVMVEISTCLSCSRSRTDSRMSAKWTGCTAKIRMSDSRTASLLSDPTCTFPYSRYGSRTSRLRRVRYMRVAPPLWRMPSAMEHPRFPAPMMAIFIGLVLVVRMHWLSGPGPFLPEARTSGSYFERPVRRPPSAGCRWPR